MSSTPAALETLPGASLEARGVMLDALLERLPPWLELADPAGLAPTFRDQRDGVTWRLFTGGEVELGVTPVRAEELARAISLAPLTHDPSALHVHSVQQARPFLMRAQVLKRGEEDLLLFSDHDVEAARALEPFAARLPTEIEWEFAWRVLQLEPGLWSPASFELCADGWSLDRHELEHTGVVSGGPGVVRSGSFDRLSVEWVLPTRQPLRGIRLASIRPTLSL